LILLIHPVGIVVRPSTWVSLSLSAIEKGEPLC